MQVNVVFCGQIFKISFIWKSCLREIGIQSCALSKVVFLAFKYMKVWHEGVQYSIYWPISFQFLKILHIFSHFFPFFLTKIYSSHPWIFSTILIYLWSFDDFDPWLILLIFWLTIEQWKIDFQDPIRFPEGVNLFKVKNNFKMCVLFH